MAYRIQATDLTDGAEKFLPTDEEIAAIAKVEIAKAGTLQGTRKRVNLIEGSNVTLTVADNPGSDRVDVTIAASGGGGGGGGSVATDAIFDAKGDLAVGTGADTAAKLTVGADRTVVTADSTQSTGLKYSKPWVQETNAQTGTTYTLVLSDEGKLVTLSNGGTITLTVPPNSSVAFDVGTYIDLAQISTGAVTIAPGSGVTLNSTPGLRLRGQYSGATLRKTATDTWLVFGDLAV